MTSYNIIPQVISEMRNVKMLGMFRAMSELQPTTEFASN